MIDRFTSFEAAPSVSASYARALRLFLNSRGLDSADVVTQPAPARRVGGLVFGEALLQGERTLGAQTLGIDFGTRVGGAGFGLLGVAAATATTLRESITHLRRFESLTSTLGHVQTHREGATVSLIWRPVQPVPHAVIEGILSGWVSFGRYLLGEQTEVLGVCFAHRRSGPMQAYETALECPVRFDAQQYSVTVAAELLDARPRLADARLNNAMSGWLDRCTAAVTTPANQPTTRRVAALMGNGVALDSADERSLAAHLGMGPRTLQRRLAEEGVSFRHLLDAARAQHAIVSLLRDQSSLAQLSADVGFGEQSSLCRAFHRWTGYAPLALKQRLVDISSDLRTPNGEHAGCGRLVPGDPSTLRAVSSGRPH